MLKQIAAPRCQSISDTLLTIFGDNYTFEVQECQEYYHVSVLKKDGAEIIVDDYLLVHRYFLLVDSPLLVYSRLYFKIQKPLKLRGKNK
jgi:hypothetical protein